jgi:4-hydroxybenzoate polyprenyltransferase
MGYVVNDLVDAEADRLHPVKMNRPIASRKVSVNQAIRLLVMLGLPAALLSTILGWNFMAMLAG